ncbi:Cell wall-associated hydrolase, NlpC family [Promicromonospora umidemergens]|uniref:NlpC/P60 domain-containing protein n=1 Tax=Promicromonospora umidemergens TaxID=629679 RepID=A0ABP8Y0Q9_9MICO|nr:C40 family peptidase [Promicromonospora umidemergens]MCP2286780.1 Cell wall-associated hydrolase, NlpC family [Promicromonospora umidemergens]
MEPSFNPTPAVRGRGRHRAARRPVLADVARTATEQITTFAGRTAVAAAAGSGVLLSLVAAPAQAAPATELSASLASQPVQGALNSAALNALTTQAKESVAAAPVVTVAPDAELKVETAAVSVVSAEENEEYQAELAAEAEAEAEAEAAAAAEEEAEAAAAADAEAAAAVAVDVPASAKGSAIVSIGMRYLGVPYLWGGETPAGMDCSGFTSYVFAQVGINLPRTSSEQRYAGTEVPWSQAQPGDLLWSPGHIAIYAGDGMQIEAPVPGKSVRYTQVWQSNPVVLRVG